MQQHNNWIKMFQQKRIHISPHPVTLYLKRSFNTAHSSSTTRTNFIIKTSLQHQHPLSFIQNNSPQEFSISGFGQCGLPPKKPYCYLSDIQDCQSFFITISKKLQNFLLNLKTQNYQSHKFISELQKYFYVAFGQLLEIKSQNKSFQILSFFVQKYQKLVTKINNNQGNLTSQIFFYLQVFFLLSSAKDLSLKNPQYKAPRNALQFSLLDLIGNLQNKSVSELLYTNKSQFKIAQNFSFYTISHEQDFQSMLQNGKDSLQFTDCIKIKFNNQVIKLIELLKLMDQQKVGRKWIIDANASWSPSDFIKFQTLFNQLLTNNPSIKDKVLFIEQPYPIFKSLTQKESKIQQKSKQQIQQQQKQWQNIKQTTCLIIIADQSFAACEDLPQVMKYSHGINIKMEKCGGPFEALKILYQIQKNAVNYIMFGSMVSTHLGCTQTFQFNEFAWYFDIDGALLVKQPQIKGGFEWKGTQGIKKVKGYGLAISQEDIKKLF